MEFDKNCPVCTTEKLKQELDTQIRRNVDMQSKLYTQIAVTAQKLTAMQEKVYHLARLSYAQRDCIRVLKKGTDYYRDEAAKRQKLIDASLSMLRQKTPYVNTAVCILEGSDDVHI